VIRLSRFPGSWRSLRTPDGVPYLSPELLLVFKSKNKRRKDDVDAKEVIPALDEQQQDFLRRRFDVGAELPDLRIDDPSQLVCPGCIEGRAGTLGKLSLVDREDDDGVSGV
jgi:hypothetical protein